MGPDQEEDSLKRLSLRLAQLALTVLVTWFLVNRVGLGLEDLRTLEPAAWTPDRPLLLGVSCLSLFAGYYLSAALWARIVVGLGGPRLPVFEAVRLFMIANLGRYVPGKVWQIAGLAVLARGRGVSPATATGAAVLGQGVALVAASVVGVWALLDGPEPLRSWGLGVALLLAGALAVGALPPVFRRFVALGFKLVRREPPRALASRIVMGWLVLYVVNWALYAASFSLLVTSFGHPGLTPAVASSFAAAYVLGYLAVFAPAGIGIREAFLVTFLTPHLGVGAAGAMAVVARLWATVVEAVPAAAFWMRHVASSSAEGAHPPEDAGE
ncbi:MAG: lysylphosphatidylglycerol synthase domain-containing protein [Gemmatimonadota bacterium]